MVWWNVSYMILSMFHINTHTVTPDLCFSKSNQVCTAHRDILYQKWCWLFNHLLRNFVYTIFNSFSCGKHLNPIIRPTASCRSQVWDQKVIKGESFQLSDDKSDQMFVQSCKSSLKVPCANKWAAILYQIIDKCDINNICLCTLGTGP